eukprot:GHVS01035767.1.p1 GENE.GHVS01035767.1~~GHVS01035767.1.p1  ORF type:complete len:809 (+),score=185.41 GHVS01035767.1:230-2656(+)
MAAKLWFVCVLFCLFFPLSIYATSASSRFRQLGASSFPSSLAAAAADTTTAVPPPTPTGRSGALAALVGNEDVQLMLKEILKAVATGATSSEAASSPEQVKTPEAVVVETDETKSSSSGNPGVQSPAANKGPLDETTTTKAAEEAGGLALDKAKAMLGLSAGGVDVLEEEEEEEEEASPNPVLNDDKSELNNSGSGDGGGDVPATAAAVPATSGGEEELIIAKNLEPSAVDDISVPKEEEEGISVAPPASPDASSVSVFESLYKTTEGVMGEGIDQSTIKYLMESVLRIHVIRTIEDFGKPWTTKGEGRATGSGFPIPNRLIITNAHVASDAHIVRIERPGSPRLWDARVISIAHEPDLCVMTVDGEAFWNGLHPLEFVKNPVPSGAGAAGRQDVPDILDGVYVVGYPTGGDSLSVTQGIVSRVEVGYYAHSSAYLLEIQIDAAINPGNSGGPVVNNRGEVVGVAFQGLTKADSIGYIIPVPIVNHILTDIEDNGGYTGMVSLGVLIQSLRNPVLQDFLGVSEIPPASLPAGVAADGVVVTKVDDRRVAKFQAQFPHWGDLGFRENDVILALDGQNVAEDGSIHFRNVERVAMNFLLCGKYEDDFIDATVLRKKIVINIQVPLDVPEYLVPMHTNNVKPRYLMYGGAIFVPLTKQYILDFKKARNRVGLSTKLNRYQSTFRTDEQKEVVVLSRILSSRSTKGYNIQNKIVSKVNCKKFRDLEHLAELLGVVQPKVQMVEGAAAVGEGSGAAAVGDGDMVKAVEAAVDRDFVRIGFNDDNFNFVLDRNLAKKTDEHLMTFHRIAHPYYL